MKFILNYCKYDCKVFNSICAANDFLIKNKEYSIIGVTGVNELKIYVTETKNMDKRVTRIKL